MRRVLSLLLLLCHGAAAERRVEVHADARAPFTAADLADALRVRVAPAGRAIRVDVIAVAGGVQVATARGSRTIELEGRIGAEAARLVALAAVDLVADEAAEPPASSPALVDTVEASAVRATPLTISVLGTGAAWSSVLAGGTIDFALQRGHFVAALELGGGKLTGGELDLTSGIVRLGAGARFSYFELRAGATLAPIFVATGAGDQTVLAGGGASLRARLPITTSARLVLAGGVDAFATHTVYHDRAMTIATPWVMPWLAAGLEVAP